MRSFAGAGRGGCALLAVTLLFGGTLRPASGATRYSIVPLDVLPGGLDSQALGLNDRGQIVGASLRNRSGNVGQSRPVVWDASGQPTELWSNQSVGGNLFDINNAGEIVGNYGSGLDIPLPGPGVPYGRAFYWNSTVGLQDIGFEPLGNSEAVAINESGLVAGSSERTETALIDGSPVTGFTSRAFVWDAVGGIRDLENPAIGFLGSFARDVNNKDEVVGYGGLPSGHEGAFVWDETQGMRLLRTTAGNSSRAVAINDLDQVLGVDYGIGPVIWDLQTGGVTPVPGGIEFNNLGQAIDGPFLIDKGVRRLLTDLIPSGSAWAIENALAINDERNIVGYGLLNGKVRGFLMTPVPEPTALQVLVGTVAFMAGQGRLRKRT